MQPEPSTQTGVLAVHATVVTEPAVQASAVVEF
jgi:hypothetical protein